MADRERRAFETRVVVRDVLVHALVPVVLLLAYLAPVPYETFLYQPGRSGIGDAYWSTIGHADLTHLLTNVFGYLVLVSVSFALIGRANRRRYYALFVPTLVVVPPLTAGLLEAYFQFTPIRPGESAGGAGFSIVTAALLALLAAATAIHQRRALERSIPPAVTGLCLFALAAAVPAVRATGLGILPAVLVGIGCAYLLFDAWLLADHVGRGRSTLAVALQFSAVVIFLGSTVDLFLIESRAWAGHFLGFLSGAAVVVSVTGVWRLQSLLGGQRERDGRR